MAVTQPSSAEDILPSHSALSAFGGVWSRIASASSISSMASRVPSSPTAWEPGLGLEELDILFLPGDPELLALAALEGRVLVAGDLREHALAAGEEVQLHEVAQELDEHDLALGGVHVAGRGARAVDLHGRGPDGEHRGVADRVLARIRPAAGAHLAV